MLVDESFFDRYKVTVINDKKFMGIDLTNKYVQFF